MRRIEQRFRGPATRATAVCLAFGCGGGTAHDRGTNGSGGQRNEGGDGSGQAVGGGGAGGAAEAVVSTDAPVCDSTRALSTMCATGSDTVPCCGACGEELLKTADMVACAIELNSIPTDRNALSLLVNCILLPAAAAWDFDAGGPAAVDGWSLDYSGSAVRIVFGASLCAQVKQQSNVPIHAFYGCSIVC
jgi:hypothetical protein